jgi:hypothetical protein
LLDGEGRSLGFESRHVRRPGVSTV